jgi:uncharacterized membrane protein
MAKDVADVVGTALGQLARESAHSVSKSLGKRRRGPLSVGVGRRNGSPLSGAKGIAAGAGLAALAPLAAKGAKDLISGLGSNGAGPLHSAQEKVSGAVKDKVSGSVKDAMPSPGDAIKGAIPGVGGDEGGQKGGKSQGQPGVGKGRRMPVQQAVDIGVPLQTVYNQFTQFEDWPKFMHRVQQVSQEDESHVAFKAKIWGISKEFKAEIEEQRPDERIKWRVAEGMTHTGVVTFHKLAPRLTRVEISLDVEPGSLIEKAARGMRHVKRAVRADLARFKAYVMMEEDASGSWRGEIDDGEVKKRRSGGSRPSSGGRSGGSSSSRRSGSQRRSGSSGGQSGSSSGRSGGASRSRAASSGAGGRSASVRGGSSSRSRSRGSSNGSGSGSSKGAGSRSRSRKTSGSKS